ncbi:MAG: glycerophosphoryl diester phosphodiesterase membrane domain-containing protein [Ornithinimicrobium sp.]
MSDGPGAGPPPGWEQTPGAETASTDRYSDRYGQRPPGHGQDGPGYQQDATGYGHQSPSQPSWHQVAPEHVARMYQPGVIPLRPLKLADIFGGAINTIRRNPEATVGLSVIVLGAFLLPSLLISLAVQNLVFQDEEVAFALGLVLPSLTASFATLILSGLILYVVSEAALGDKVGLGQTWKAVRRRILALIGVSLLTGIIITVVFAVGIFALVATIAVGEPLAVVIGVLAMVLTIVAAIWLAVRLLLTTAPIVLERAGPIQAIRRSWRLSAGSQFWRLLGIWLLAQLIAAIMSGVVSTPLQTIFLLAAGTFTQDESLLLTFTVFGQHLTQFLVGLLVTPFTAGVTALLYLDQRIRREGLDIAMQQAASARTAARSRR